MTTDTSAGATVVAAVAALLLVLLGVAVGVGATLRRQRRRDARFLATEVALKESQDRLRHAFEAASEIVWDWDLVSDELYHPSWAQTYGFPEERTPRTGAALVPFIHPDDMARFHAELTVAVAGPRDRFEVEHRALTGTGEWRWMLGRARVVERDAGGRATRVVGTCTDITEHRRMRTRLEIADRMASIGTLAAGVAHELNNPLAYVLGNVAFALDRLEALPRPAPPGSRGPEDALRDCAAALEDARSGAERMRDIVADMKLFSRPEEDTRTPVQVSAALRAALSLADHEIRHRARVVADLAPVPPVLANESRLSQVFLNLLVNAAQAIPEGHADRNEIRVTVREDRHGRVEVAVRDTGCGVAAEHRKRLFDPFFTTKPAGVGTGLGLSICHGIVSALGGEIDVESEPGEGSTFRVILPAASAPLRADPAPAQAAVPPPPRRARVLVVDDEPLFCRMAGRALALEHDTETLTDSREALRRLRAGERYDVVVTDLAMPVLTGMELHAEIARMDPDLAGRMVFVTGGAFTPRAAEFVARHPERVLQKPLSAEVLRARVRGVLEDVLRRAGAPAA